MSKGKIQLEKGLDVDALLNTMANFYKEKSPLLIDGVKIDFSEGWVHMRKSNTEPIIRVYSEASSQQEADALTQRFSDELLKISTNL
jgi:phosphomannomutase